MSTLPNPSPSAADFYREALAQSFRYSAMLSGQTGRRAEEIVDTPQFAAALRESSPESLEAARRIADMTVVHLSAAAAPWPWWKELLAYERARFLPAVTSDQRLVTYFPRRGVAASTVHFTWDMPQLLKAIEAHQPPPENLRRNLTLLFSRDPAGKICVIELESPVAAVFRATNGMRKPEQIAAAAAVQLEETMEILRALAEIGAVENV